MTVGDYAEKIQAKAQGVLEGDERVLAAIRTSPRGATVAAGVGGLVGGLVAARQAKKGAAEQAEGSAAGMWPPVRCAVALTDRRLLIYGFTALGQPKDVIAEFSLDQLASVEIDKGFMNKVRFAFTDGSAAKVECGKVEKVDNFATAFQEVKMGRH
jgi:hypothetical protein